MDVKDIRKLLISLLASKLKPDEVINPIWDSSKILLELSKCGYDINIQLTNTSNNEPGILKIWE